MKMGEHPSTNPEYLTWSDTTHVEKMKPMLLNPAITNVHLKLYET